jgi:hypothetical protein
MYKWYGKAVTCYAYLEDVLRPDDKLGQDVVLKELESALKSSRWFRRGWTLQELLAPRGVVFFGFGWVRLGTKQELGSLISKVSGIDEEYLPGKNINAASIAKRMSWASKRKTTRVEDIDFLALMYHHSQLLRHY